MLFILTTALVFAATASTTPGVSARDLTANAALNSLIADSFSGAFPGVVLATTTADAGCKTSRDCPRCKKCTLCDNWKPGCCKRISPLCGHVDAAAALDADAEAKPLCNFCSSKACFQIVCEDATNDELGSVFDDPSKIPTSDSEAAEAVYDFDLVLDRTIESAGTCGSQGIACGGGVCWVKTC